MNVQRALLLASLQLDKVLTYTDISDALGVTRQYVNKLKDKDLSEEQIETIEACLNVNLHNYLYADGACELRYYNLPKITDVVKNPLVTTLWVDRELILKVWNKNPDDLRIISMPGDTMDGGEMPLRNGDVLIIDTSITNPVIGGIYAYTTQADSLFFVAGIKQVADGTLQFHYKNPVYEPVIRTPEELEEMDFKIIGRVTKDVSSELIIC